MPRRNNREQFEPLDLTPEALFIPRPPFKLTPTQRAARDREKMHRQVDAIANGGIDWLSCIVPGCIDTPMTRDSGRPNRRNHRLELPICLQHSAVVVMQAEQGNNHPLVVDALAKVVEARAARTATEESARQQQFLERTNGDIYYVRLNGLIKVGWSRELEKRLRAYGPDVEVLCHYPATRDDETNLHRQLRPFLARGREWYEDCPALADFVAKAIAEYGTPNAGAWWSTPKQIVGMKRSMRRR